MALDPTSFSLDAAIGKVWNSGVLSDEHKQLICNCLPDDRAGRPHGEDELDKLQLALSACDFLNGIPGSRIHWLSHEGQHFPEAVRKFIYNAAREFHKTGLALPDHFIASLVDFVSQTKSHVGTLNYDNLLYQPMIERGLLQGYNGALIDGFHNAGSDPSNLERKFGRTFGYYLHLHGSPLFVDRRGRTVKLLQSDLPWQTDTVSSHIVLTHFEHKLTVISASDVLLSYWQLLAKAIDESEEIVLVGYSGADAHFNDLIRATSDTPVRVVEWEDAGEEADRIAHWREQCSRDVSLVRLESILDFQEWE